MKLCGFEVGNDQPFFLISGTCVVESEQMSLDTAGTLKEMTAALGIPFIYKSSFDKANRSSGDSFRGPGMQEGLRILQKVKDEKEAAARTRLAHELALPAREKLVRTVAALYDFLLATVTNPGELGTVANWEQHNFPDILDKPGEELDFS